MIGPIDHVTLSVSEKASISSGLWSPVLLSPHVDPDDTLQLQLSPKGETGSDSRCYDSRYKYRPVSSVESAPP